ncbi:hypothetical protein FYK55_06045 [Roseiconus nitratireducens]|uniref:RNA polymerase sigma-70 factor (ECF subfamily) n=1 Tax=Roseiconus nitratireducens TaxID=2605748 RepID=A0A5M6DCI4_9BACT|nr:hypothetical protein [Roseiconus nitratireducens]KAA5545224.1 hypothetical protein FYK55_06045 [Roseiconus nitratireducens]
MNRWPETQTTLLQRMSDPRDDAAWLRFDELYRPVIYRYARARGLQHSDAESLVAEVMSRVFRAARRWAAASSGPNDGHRTRTRADANRPDERPQHFRAWLYRVAENSLLNLVTRQLARRGTGGTSHQLSMAGRPMPDELSREIWQTQHQQQLFMRAARAVQSQVDSEHWEVFWRTHVDGDSIPQTAERFARSTGSVYAIRSRILKRLRDQVNRMKRLDDASTPDGETA